MSQSGFGQPAPAGPGLYQGTPYQAASGHPAAPSTPARPGLRIILGDALVGGGALLVFLFSFTPFVRYGDADLLDRLEEENLPTWFSAWSLETFLAPLTWWVIFAALGLMVQVGLRFTPPKDREFFGFRSSQIQVTLSAFSFLILLGYALSAKTVIFGSELQDELQADGDLTLAWGGVLMLLGSLVAAVGAVLDHLGVGPTIWPQPPKPAYPQAGHPGYPPAGYSAPHGHPQGYPQGYAADPQGYPQAPASYPQTNRPEYSAGNAPVQPPGQPGMHQ